MSDWNVTAPRKDRSNDEWLAGLQGPDSDLAIGELRELLLRGLRAALANQVRSDLNSILEDFVQDALIKVLDNLDSFRGESRFTTWAQKIAVNVAFTELRRRRWKDVSLHDLTEREDGSEFTPEYFTTDEVSPEQQASQNAMMAFVQRMVAEELTDKQREVMMMVMVGGVPLAEVAERLGTNRNALYKLLHDARKRLKQAMLAEGLTPEQVLASFE